MGRAAGKLDRLVTIKTVTETKDAEFNGVESAQTTLAQVWAEKKDISGREFFSAAVENSEVDTVFRIRHRTDVTTKHRIAYGNLDYDIVAIAELGRREGLELRCKARVG